MMNHIQTRLAERGIKISESTINSYARLCNDDTALLIMSLDNHIGDSKSEYHERTESNGNKVILIVRNRIAKTIMYRRENQPFTPEALNVEIVKDMS